jgi:FlaA1/EpsC-like NDP-sugar epimerase
MLGIDYGCHQWHSALAEGNQFRICAFIDDEPWNHRTRIGNAPVHYPSELMALLHKHRACAVVQVNGCAQPVIETTLLHELQCQKIPLLTLPVQVPPDADATIREMLANDG